MIPVFKVFMPESVMAPLRDVLFSGYVGEGARARQFENELATWFGNPNTVVVNTGTAALQLALRLAGVGPGAEVISTPMTCVATNEPIVAAGARPVWGDIDPWTGNLLADDVARKITPRTRAIVVMHWGGYPCDLEEIGAIGRRFSIPVIEDACHAMGAVYRGRLVGSHSNFVCFSFQALKHVTTVDGGALACRDAEDAQRARRLRWYGIDRAIAPEWRWEQDITEFGYKCHMNDVIATIGIEALKHAHRIVAIHRRHAAAYDQALRDCAPIRPLRYRTDRLSAYWLYTVRVKRRRQFMDHMTKAGVAVSRVHARNDRYSVFASSKTELRGVDEFDAEQVSIPCGWWLGDDDVACVIEAMRRFAATCREVN